MSDINKEQLEEALKVVKEPITVNSIEYKYFDIENYNKLVQAIDYCNYLDANVKPYVEAQDKEINRLNNIIDGLEKYISELLWYDNESDEYRIGIEILNKLKELEGDNK